MSEVNNLLDIFVNVGELVNYSIDYPLLKPTLQFEAANVTLIVTDDCNLRCTYCYCNKEANRMSWETAKDFIDFRFDLAKDFHLVPRNEQNHLDHRIIWEFIGGEPLLEASLMFRCMEYISENIQRLPDGHPWKRTDWPCECGKSDGIGYRFMVGTNGLLLNDPRIQRELLKYKGVLHVGMTLDGDREMHDLCRLDTEGLGSFERVMRAWVWLREVMPQAVQTTKSTIAHENVGHIFRIAKFFQNLEPQNFYLMQNCVFENVWWRGDQFTLFHQLCETADFILEGEKWRRFMVRWFDTNIFGKTTAAGNWCGASGTMNACDHTGTLYPCLRFKHIDQREPYALGTLKTGMCPKRREAMNHGNPIFSPKQKDVMGVDCLNCNISSLCSDCQAGAYNVFGRLDVKAPFLCPMHKAVAMANVYFFGKLIKFTSTPDHVFRDHLIRLLDEFTKDNYFGFTNEGRKIEWKPTM